MKRSEFDWLVRDALGSFHDWAALETHPLAASLPQEVDEAISRAERLRRLLLAMIERLRPDGGEPDRGARPWRPYVILTERYVEGRELRELESRLALSTRQLGREHTRALRALSSLLQAQLPQAVTDEDQESQAPEPEPPAHEAFEINPEKLTWSDLLRSVAEIAQGQAQAAGRKLDVVLANPVHPIEVDRVIGRQILLSLLTHAIRHSAGERIVIRVMSADDQDRLSIRWLDAGGQVEDEGVPTALRLAEHWTKRLGGTLSLEPGSIALALPLAKQAVVLVVDDQLPAIRLFERYLSRSGLNVVGTQEPERVLDMARELQPRVITLDVMMPNVDGWEVLQSLQSDPDTEHIPVIICTIWDVGDVTAGFGAAGFLEKPVTQRALLSMLEDLGVTDTSA